MDDVHEILVKVVLMEFKGSIELDFGLLLLIELGVIAAERIVNHELHQRVLIRDGFKEGLAFGDDKQGVFDIGIDLVECNLNDVGHHWQNQRVEELCLGLFVAESKRLYEALD